MKNVIDFEDYKLKKRFSQFKGTWDLSYIEGIEGQIGGEGIQLISHVRGINDLHECIEVFRDFNRDKMHLEKDLLSDRTQYKFPTVISRYRSTLDTFTSLYLFLQEALFKYEDEVPEHRWIISMFEDDKFIDDIVCKLTRDIINMELFQRKYASERDKKSISRYLGELNDKKELYTHYLDIFITVKDIEYD